MNQTGNRTGEPEAQRLEWGERYAVRDMRRASLYNSGLKMAGIFAGHLISFAPLHGKGL